MIASSSPVVRWADRAPATIPLQRRTPQQVTIKYDDQAIHYSAKLDKKCSPQAPGANCNNTWWPVPDALGGGYMETVGLQSSLSFSFKGSKITLDPYLESSGAWADIQLNGYTEHIDFNRETTALKNQPWSMSGLDETQQSNLTITWVQPNTTGFRFIAIKSLIYETNSPPAVETNANSGTSQDNNKNDQTISIAAGLSGAFALLVVILMFAIWWFRRKRNDHSPPGRRLDRPHYSQRIESQFSSFHGHGSSSHGHGSSSHGHGSSSHGHGSSSHGHGSSSHGHGIYAGVAMQEGPVYLRNNSVSSLGHVGGHSHSNSLGVMLPASNSNSTSDLLRPHERGPFAHVSDRDPFVHVPDRDPFATPQPTPPPRAQHSPFLTQQSAPPLRAQHSPLLTPQPSNSPRPQHSHYAYDADHEPAPIPAAQGGSLAIDVLPESRPTPANRPNRNARRGNGGASPTDTHTSYESWTSSDFGPIPSPLFVNAPPVPAIPPHLRPRPARPGSPSGEPERGAGPVDAEKRRLAMDADARPAVGGSLTRPGPASRQSTQPPRYSAILD